MSGAFVSIIYLAGFVFIGWYVFTKTDLLNFLKTGLGGGGGGGGSDPFGGLFQSVNSSISGALAPTSSSSSSSGADTAAAVAPASPAGRGKAPRGKKGAPRGKSTPTTTATVPAKIVAPTKGRRTVGGGGRAGRTGGGGSNNSQSAPDESVKNANLPLAAAAVCGPTIYRATGRRSEIRDTGEGGVFIHLATQKNVQSGTQTAFSRRINAYNCPFSSYEATIYFTFDTTKRNCSRVNPPLLIKMWGPHHSIGNCCWCMVSIFLNGDVCFAGEGPHPSALTCVQKLGNVGSLQGKLVGLKAVIWPQGGAAHQEVYVDTGSGGWKSFGQRNGSCGHVKTSNRVTTNPPQEVGFRIDCTGIKVKCAEVAEIVPGVRNAGGGAAAAGLSARVVSQNNNKYYDGMLHYAKEPKARLLYRSNNI